MYICYIDESGHVGEQTDPNEPVEVVCGVLTDLTKLTKTQREHRQTLNKLQVPELKAQETYRGRRDWASVKPEKRDEVFGQVLQWATDRNCLFIVAPIDCSRFFARKAGGCQTAARLQYPWEAGVMNVLLALQRHHRSKKGNKGRTLVICDEQKDHSNRLLDIFEGDLSFTDGYTGYKPPKKGVAHRLDQVIDVPHFSRSHLSILIQVADWAAYTVRSHLLLTVYGAPEAYAGEKAKFQEWFASMMQNTLPASKTGPAGSDPVCEFYREHVRPNGWS